MKNKKTGLKKRLKFIFSLPALGWVFVISVYLTLIINFFKYIFLGNRIGVVVIIILIPLAVVIHMAIQEFFPFRFFMEDWEIVIIQNKKGGVKNEK